MVYYYYNCFVLWGIRVVFYSIGVFAVMMYVGYLWSGEQGLRVPVL